MATIVDVARLAGVSTSTVSHVMNATRPVAEATRQRVMDAVQAVDYRQDVTARSMRRSQTDSIGLVVSDVAQPMFAEMVRGVEQEAQKAGITVLLANSGEQAGHESTVLRALAARRVDGIVLAPVAGSNSFELQTIQERGTPIVLMDRLGMLDVDQVGIHNSAPTAELVRHLAQHGHRRIALVMGDPRVATMKERRQGYEEGISASGLPVDPALIVISAGSAEETASAVTLLLQSPNRPTAIFAASTTTAAGTLHAAQELGLRCPEDLAFAAFDGFAYPDLFRPRITTITQPARDVGAAAFQLLHARLQGRAQLPYTVLRLEPTVNYRESCGCPR